MKKSELKTGMRVKTARGDYFLVIKDIDSCNYGHQEVAFVNEGGFCPGSEYNESLVHKTSKDYSIEAVYAVAKGGTALRADILDFKARYLIWHRKENVTLAESEDILVDLYRILSEKKEEDPERWVLYCSALKKVLIDCYNREDII